MSAFTARTKSMNKASASEKILAALPAKEIIWVRMKRLNGDVFVVASTVERTSYSLYQVMESGFKRMAKSTNPKEFDMIVYPEETSQ